MSWLIAHGAMELILLIVTGLLSVIVNSLRSTLNSLQKSVDDLSKSNTALSLVVSKEYLTRKEYKDGEDAIWARIDQHGEQITRCSERITRVEAGRHG